MLVNTVNVLQGQTGASLFGTIQTVRFTAEFWLILSVSFLMVHCPADQAGMINELLDIGNSFYNHGCHATGIKLLRRTNGAGKGCNRVLRLFAALIAFMTLNRSLPILRAPQKSALLSVLLRNEIVTEPCGISLRTVFTMWESVVTATLFSMIFHNTALLIVSNYLVGMILKDAR